jgi:hypothetical protein
LRSVRGHFQGGNWNPTVDSWGQRKHQVLAQLGARLGRRGTPESHVLAWLGAPDEKAMPGTRWWKLTEHGPGTHLLIYCWRSHHDFLFFVCDGPRVVSSNWWMAEE